MSNGQGRAHHGEILHEATKLAEAGTVTPRVEIRRFNLASAEDAHRTVEQRQVNGKNVIDVSK